MTQQDSIDEIKREIFKILCFVVTSARGCVTDYYGPLRLLETGNKLIEFLETLGISDEFLSKQRQRLNEAKFKGDDPENMLKELDDICVELVKALRTTYKEAI